MRSLAAVLPILGSLAIAVGLIAVSYGHIYSFAEKAGALPWEAAILAATVDGAIVVALAVTGLAKARGQEPPKIAKVTLVVAVVATGAANLDHGIGHGWRGVAAAVWVPLVAELAYLLAMATHRVGAGSGHQEEAPRPVICGGRVVPVATVMVRVSAARAVAEEEAAAVAARPVICGHLVSVAALAGTVPVAVPDTRPLICGHTVPVAALAGSLPVAEEVRPDICGQVTSLANLAITIPAAPVPEERPVICHQTVTPEELTAPLSDDRPVICGGHLVSVAEVLAHTPVATPVTARPDTTPDTDAADITATVATATGPREDTVMEWLTDPTTTATVDTAKGADIVELLSAAGHGRVSERTGRRILATVREALSEDTVTA